MSRLDNNIYLLTLEYLFLYLFVIFLYKILYLYHKCRDVVAKQVPISKITQLGLFDKLVKMKYDVPNDALEMFDGYKKEIDKALDPLLR